jgi:hypothetical protein
VVPQYQVLPLVLISYWRSVLASVYPNIIRGESKGDQYLPSYLTSLFVLVPLSELSLFVFYHTLLSPSELSLFVSALALLVFLVLAS